MDNKHLCSNVDCPSAPSTEQGIHQRQRCDQPSDAMIYVHIPFCHRKCAYCAFYSIADRRRADAYIDALQREVAQRRRPSSTCQPPTTFYLGGGTPSILTLGQHQRVKEIFGCAYDLSSLKEATIEANPEDLSPTYLQGLRELHFYNRISIGVQSFNDNELQAINRRHSAQQAIDAVHRATEAGFNNISIDLIYGLPHQTLDSWQHSLDMAFSLPIQHLSAYALSVEPGTILERQVQQGRALLPDEEQVMQMYDRLCHTVAHCPDWSQYEISSFCHAGNKSVHNSGYWRRCRYDGYGAAAHSFDGCHRRWNVSDVDQYIHHLGYEEETLSPADGYNETLMLGFRNTAGIPEHEIMQRYPQYYEMFVASMHTMMQRGWVERDDTSTYRPTATGMLHADGMAAELFVA